MSDAHPGHETAASRSTEAQWIVLGAAVAASSLLFAMAAPPRTALYWYIFPLFGVGATYLIQFRAEFSPR
jgi:hypothetical protein